MKKILIAGAVVFAAMTTVALAGAPAEPAAAPGCAGAAKCQGRALLVPTVVEAKACSGAQRVTLSERRAARRAARANAATTRAAFIDAARQGSLVSCAGAAVAMPTMKQAACERCK